MAFNATDCAFEGFRVVRKHPGAFAIWCLFYLLVIVVAAVVMVATMLPLILSRGLSNAQLPQSNNFAEVAAFIQGNLPLLLFGAVIFIPLILIWTAMMMCAVYRAVLRPEEKGFGYLRLGGDEFRIVGLSLLIMLLFLVAGSALGGLFFGLIVAMGKGPGGIALVLLLGFVAFLAYVFVTLRLALCGPQTFAERRIDLFGSWRLTEGHFWGLFGMYLLVIVLMIGVQIVNWLLGLPFRAMQPHLAHGDLSSLPPLLVGGLIYGVLAFVIAVLNLVVTAAPWAAAYRELTPRKDDEAAKVVA